LLRLFRHYLSGPALFLCLCEFTVVALALYVAATVLVPPDAQTGAPVARYLAAALVPAFVNAVLMYSMGLYDVRHVANLRRALPRLAVCLCVGAPLLGSTLVSNSTTGNEFVFYATWTGLVVTCVLVGRIVAIPLSRSRFPGRRVLVMGAGRLAAEIEQMMKTQSRSGTEVVGYVAADDDMFEVPESRVTTSRSKLKDIARETGATEIVVALDDRRGMPLQPLLDARMEGITVTPHLNFWERETRRLNLASLDPGWLIYGDGFHFGSLTNRVLKRLLDILASLTLLVLTLPTLLLAAIAIKLEGKGPVFYRQERVGRRGRTFHIYKFRTMRVDAEQTIGPQWATVKDPRVTRVGSFLRRMRIDELPQIMNVLKGEMSLVGPRPERPTFVESLNAQIPFYNERHAVRPGITGWAQVSYPYGASTEDAREKLSYDLYYIKNFSFVFDLLILLSTARAVFFDDGAR